MVLESPIRMSTNRSIEPLIDRYCPKHNASILDVGCGQGQYCQSFQAAGIHGSYLGIDIKRDESWQEREANGLRVSFLTCNVAKLPELKQTFNFILAIQSLEHVKDDMQAMETMTMCLERGSHLMITVPSKYSFFLYGTHGYRRYSISAIKRLAGRNGLRVEELVRAGGLASFSLHFILWTIPSILLKIKIWRFYQNSRLLTGLIIRLERLSYSLDKVFRWLEGGYVVVLQREY